MRREGRSGDFLQCRRLTVESDAAIRLSAERSCSLRAHNAAFVMLARSVPLPNTSAAHNRRRLGVLGAAQGVFRITLAQYPRKAIRTCSWRFPNLPAAAAPDARQRLVSRELTGSVGSPGDQGSRAPSARSSALRTIARWRRSSAGRRRGEPRVTDWFS